MDHCATNNSTTSTRSQTPVHPRLDKLLVILGATGTGKSRLSIDLATTHFPTSEIINSDKIQVYNGLDITTNKLPPLHRRSIPHHLIGVLDRGDLTSSDYRILASAAVSQIISRRNLPLLVGGSNSLIHALLAAHFTPGLDVFADFVGDPVITTDLRYKCCFLWVDVTPTVLNRYLERRVDEMLESGMVEELARYYESAEFQESEPGTGLRKAIGVPEFERYFRMFPGGNVGGEECEDRVRRVVYEEAVRAVKENTIRLAQRQVEKIVRLKSGGWNIHRLDATAVFEAALDGGGERCRESEIWEREVVQPSVKIVKRFLEEE